MENIPTAEDLLTEIDLELHRDGNTYSESSYYFSEIPPIMIEFAKLHVKAALEEVVNNVKLINYDDKVINDYVDDIFDKKLDVHIEKESILNAYPEKNIK